MGYDDCWECSVGDIAAPVKNALVGGPFGSNLVSRDYVESGVPVIRGQNMGLGRWVDGDFVFVGAEKADSLSANLAYPGDLVFTQRGTIGQVALVPARRFERYLISQSQMKLTVDSTKADPMFLYYVFRTDEQQAYIRRNAIQTGVPHTNLGILRDTPIRLPSLRVQKAVAHILGTLDDKVELNRRINETLEAMARAVFKSWFVDFDPVRAKAEGRKTGLPKPLADLFPGSFDDSELGEIPAGWRVGAIENVAENPRNGVQPEEIDPGTPYIGLEHMPRRCIALCDWSTGDALESSKYQFKRGDILFGKLRPYFHKVGVAPVDGVCSTDILVVVPKSPPWFGFVFGHVSSVEFVNHTDAASTGTKMPRTNWGDMARYEVAVPDERLAGEFTSQARPLIERIVGGIHESRALAALRDALLPKLLSGEIRIADRRARLANQSETL